MSGTIGDNVYRASGVVAAASAGGISWQSVTTGATLTAVAGNGYPIDTTSNACTITLPGSASVGDEIIFTDYDRTWETNKIIIDSNGLNYQSKADSWLVQYNTDGQSVHIVYMDATNGWIPISDDDVGDAPLNVNSEGIFGFGKDGSVCDITNLVSNAGVVATDVTGVGTARDQSAACEYGEDKGIFGFGYDGSNYLGVTNLVSNAGVVTSDVTAVGTVRYGAAACGYGGDKGIFGYGKDAGYQSMTNLVTNAGVVGTDVTGVGTARRRLAATQYGSDKGIFGYGDVSNSGVGMSNLVSNSGVVASDVAAVGTARGDIAACGYGGDKGIFGYGSADGGNTAVSTSNLVSNSGVVAADVTGVGTARYSPAACEYGEEKGIFGFGHDISSTTAVTNLVSSAGVIASDQATTTGTARRYISACSFN